MVEALTYLSLITIVSLPLTSCQIYGIGAVLSSPSYGRVFYEAIRQVNSDPSALPPGVQLTGTYIDMDENPIKAAHSLCDEVLSENVTVVIASHPITTDMSPMAVSFTCGFYRIPVIGLSARNSAFSEKNVHTSFMRTVAPYSDQASVWVEMVSYFGWKSVVFMHSSDEEGRALLGRFQNFAGNKGIEIEKNIQYMSGMLSYINELNVMTTVQSKVILLYASVDDAELIYRDAAALNLTGTGSVWIVTEQALNIGNAPIGVIGLRQVDNDNEAAHIQDSVRIIAKAFNSLIPELASYNETISPAPHKCESNTEIFESGPELLRTLRLQRLEDGVTGVVEFNEVGDRINPVYNVLNKQYRGLEQVGLYGANEIIRTIDKRSILEDQDFLGRVKRKAPKLHEITKLEFTDTPIVWPGNQTTKPKGIKISTHLKVVTIRALPFVYAEPMDADSEECDIEVGKIPCPQHNSTGPTMYYCCYGYAIDLLGRLAAKVNFTYDLHLSETENYGSYERKNGSSEKEWNGMLGELIREKSDLIVAPLTIDPERAEAIDFSKPFKYQGLTILVKKTTKDSSLASFLQPFQDTLWILVGLSVHVVALVLYLLDRFSPFGRFKLAKSDDTEEDALNLSSAMWFAWGVLLNSGIGEGTPRSFSARVLGMVWAGFAMIIVASYTANLAAFLVLDRPEASISGIDDARLRNPQELFKYATVKDSAVAMYFKRQVELSTMYRTMQRRNYANAEDAIKDVKNEKLQAFIWDSSRLEYEAANDCDLVTAGELFGRSGYGIGLPKNSPWTHEISLAILTFHESGQMEELEGKWILLKDNKCPEKDTSPATLGLTNMAGVFMMVAGGIVAGVFLIFIEIAYKKHRGLKEKELELAKTAADRWRGNIEKRRTLRRTLLLQQQERQKPNGTSASPSHNTHLGPGQNTHHAPPLDGPMIKDVDHVTIPGGSHAYKRPITISNAKQPKHLYSNEPHVVIHP